jgi:hypothetical protein
MTRVSTQASSLKRLTEAEAKESPKPKKPHEIWNLQECNVLD